jgi:ribosomal protein S18 acetylase RimI-like enzyme
MIIEMMDFNIASKEKDYSLSLYHALVDDAFYIAMEASVDQNLATPKEGMVRYMAYSMQEAAQYGELVLSETGRHGASIWSKPLDQNTRAEQSALKKQFIKEYMGANSLDTYQSIVDFMSAAAEDVVKDTFWYLSIVGVHPDLQGRGLGGPLIRPVLERTDALGVPTFLETFTRQNMSFYERLGYKAAASFEEPLTRTEYWIMVREPGVSGQS